MTTIPVPTIDRVRAKLSCNHVIEVAVGHPVGDRVTCDKCPNPAGGPPRQRRIKKLMDALPSCGTDREQADVTELAATVVADADVIAALAAEHGITEQGAAIVNAWNRHPSPELLAAADAHQAEAPQASDDRMERLALAKQEHAAMKAWEAAGRQGDKPPSPNLDAMNADHAAGIRTTRKSRKNAAPGRERKAGIRFYIGDRRMPDSQNKLSSVAWQATKGLGDGGSRWSTTVLAEALAARGIHHPEAAEWATELRNGVTISAKIENP